MISRKSTKALADFYHMRFEGSRSVTTFYGNVNDYYVLKKDQLYDFLYNNDFDAWLLNATKSLSRENERGLKEFIMRLHTGESVVSATPNWDWGQRSKLGQRLIKDLAEAILKETTKPNAYVPTYQSRVMQKLTSELELDGYIFRDRTLFFTEAAVLDTEGEEGILERLCKDLGLNNFDTIAHHLKLSHEHYINELWDDCISNSRKVLESILQEIASKHHMAVNGTALNDSTYSRPVAVRNYLEQIGLVEPKEKEAIAKIYGLLSETGGHPYIAQKDQARLMRHLSLTFSQFSLLRLQGIMSS